MYIICVCNYACLQQMYMLLLTTKFKLAISINPFVGGKNRTPVLECIIVCSVYVYV